MKPSPCGLSPEWLGTVRRLGLRLRELRKQAGLTQNELALRLGRTGPGGKSYVCRIERGDFPGLRLPVLMEFVYACGAGPEGIADVLYQYVRRLPPDEERVRKQVTEAAIGLPLMEQARVVWYDTFHKPKSGRRETPEQNRDRRVREAKGQARAIRWEGRLHRVWNDVLNELRLPGSAPLAIHLRAYAGKVFGALRRTRKTRPVWRAKAMARLDEWATEHGLPPEPFTRMKQAVTVLFAEMERKGELD
ncbi:MAG: helix-turn-helix domain-containing protein [candidate division WOR-3 bacterium]|nr:helix-turn-helix domain-containing protein [candidate division WOR-3 bacterium]